MQVFELGFESTCIFFLIFVGSGGLDDMERENYLRTLLANNSPSLVMMQSSQNFALVSFVPLSSILVASVSVSSMLTTPPPHLPRQAPVVMHDRHWSNVVVRFLLEQCKEHVEAHHTVTMQSYQWGWVHKLLITQFPKKSGGISSHYQTSERSC